MKLSPINTEGYEFIAENLNKGYDQLCIFFNRIHALTPITAAEVQRMFELRNMVGVNIYADDKDLTAIGGFYHYEPYGNTGNGKMWFVVAEDDYKNLNKILSELVKWGFESCNLHKINVELRSDITFYAKILNIIGFRKEGEQEEEIKIRGKWRSVKLYGMIYKEKVETETEAESIPAETVNKLSPEQLKKELKL